METIKALELDTESFEKVIDFYEKSCAYKSIIGFEEVLCCIED